MHGICQILEGTTWEVGSANGRVEQRVSTEQRVLIGNVDAHAAW